MKKRQEGSALIFGIAVISLLGILGGSMTSLQNTSMSSLANSNDALQAQYLCESGVRYSQNQFLRADNRDDAMDEINSTGTFNISASQQFTLSVLSTGLSYVITSTGISNGVERQLVYTYAEAPGIQSVQAFGGGTGLPASTGGGLTEIITGTLKWLSCKFGTSPKEECERIEECARTYLVTGECASTYISEDSTALSDLFSGLGQVIHVVENATVGRIYSGGAVQVGVRASVVDSIVSKGKITSLGNSQIGTEASPSEIHTEGGASIGGTVFGDIHSKGDISLEVADWEWLTGESYNAPEVTGNIYTDGNVELKNKGVINGNVVVENDLHLDKGTVINGDVYVQGNITGEGTINGRIFHVGTIANKVKTGKKDTVYQVTDISAEEGYVEPSPIPYQEMPAPPVKTITPGSGVVTSTDSSPTEGNYDQFRINSDETLVLEPGEYHLSSMEIGDNAVLLLDLRETDDISLFVESGMTIGENFNIEVIINTESGEQVISTATSDPQEIALLEKYASHFYLETHGDWRLSKNGNWLGTVFSTQNLTVDSQDSDGNLIGAFHSGERLKINAGKNMSRVSSNYVKNNWI